MTSYLRNRNRRDNSKNRALIKIAAGIFGGHCWLADSIPFRTPL